MTSYDPHSLTHSCLPQTPEPRTTTGRECPGSGATKSFTNLGQWPMPIWGAPFSSPPTGAKRIAKMLNSADGAGIAAWPWAIL